MSFQIPTATHCGSSEAAQAQPFYVLVFYKKKGSQNPGSDFIKQ